MKVNKAINTDKIILEVNDLSKGPYRELVRMKKFFGFLARLMLLGALVVLAAYFFLALYYRRNFPVNTWINGIYCTGKTVEQVNEELLKNGPAENTQPLRVVILGGGGVSETIEMSEAGIRPDYTDTLREYLKQNAGGFWVNRLKNAASAHLAAEAYVWDEERLQAEFDSLDMVTEELSKKDGVLLGYDEAAGYYLKDGNRGRLDTKKAFDYIKACLSRGETVIDLTSGNCRYDREDTPQDREQRELWQKISEFTDCKIVYDMGTESILLTADITSRFLERQEAKGPGQEGLPALDTDGSLLVSREKVRSWVEQLAEEYNTYKKEREFLSTRGDAVTVKYGTYGTRIDVEAETAYLFKAVQTQRAETEIHVPAYKQKGYVRGLDDIGDTYIEIDMTQQRMYFYFEGELVLDTDVVTGDTSKRRGTPEGIYYVYSKQRNRILRGADYASFVKYWMPVVGGVGIHDASWRRSFGDEIYKTNGSHGCINTPSEKASQLYEMVKVGMPVIMFY